MPEESSTQSSRQHSPAHPAPPSANPTDTVLHRVKPGHGDATATSARDHREHKSMTHHPQQLSGEQKSSRSKTAKSAEKQPGGKTEKHSSRHRSSSLKHKASSGSSKPQSSHR